jgi:hypothetical protein
VAGRAKVIITSRKEFFRDDKAEEHVLRADKGIAQGVEKVEIQLFRPEQIQEALSKRKKPEF